MTIKKERTRQRILVKAYDLFAKKGFNAVRMKDVCEATELSRGGLYAHFSSVQEIFEAVIGNLCDQDEINFTKEIKKGTPATKILDNMLNIIKEEMNHQEDSLSLAMYEYANTISKKFMNDFTEDGEQMWIDLINYGISTGEFNEVNPIEIVTIILYVYQGVRMWSKVISIPPEKIELIVQYIRKQLIRGESNE